MLGLVSDWLRYRDYRGKTLAEVADLFHAFRLGTQSVALGRINAVAILRNGHMENTSPAETAAMIAAVALGRFAEDLDENTRRQALSAIAADDDRHPLARGLSHAINVAETRASKMHARLLVYELIGALKGMSREARDQWRFEDEFARITGSMAIDSSPDELP